MSTRDGKLCELPREVIRIVDHVRLFSRKGRESSAGKSVRSGSCGGRAVCRRSGTARAHNYFSKHVSLFRIQSHRGRRSTGSETIILIEILINTLAFDRVGEGRRWDDWRRENARWLPRVCEGTVSSIDLSGSHLARSAMSRSITSRASK